MKFFQGDILEKYLKSINQIQYNYYGSFVKKDGGLISDVLVEKEKVTRFNIGITEIINCSLEYFVNSLNEEVD